MKFPPWSVIWALDGAVQPKNWKLWVSISPADGWFLRINTKNNRPCGVLLPAARHSFLDYDSFLACGGDLIELDDAEVEAAMSSQSRLDRQGILGLISEIDRPTVRAVIGQCEAIAPARKRKMLQSLSG